MHKNRGRKPMENDSSFHEEDTGAGVRVIARLAALQRLRDQALANDRKTMLESIDRMIEAEKRALHAHRRDAEPHG